MVLIDFMLKKNGTWACLKWNPSIKSYLGGAHTCCAPCALYWIRATHRRSGVWCHRWCSDYCFPWHSPSAAPVTRAFCCAPEFHSLPILASDWANYRQWNDIFLFGWKMVRPESGRARGNEGANLPTDGEMAWHRGGGFTAVEMIFVTNFSY